MFTWLRQFFCLHLGGYLTRRTGNLMYTECIDCGKRSEGVDFTPTHKYPAELAEALVKREVDAFARWRQNEQAAQRKRLLELAEQIRRARNSVNPIPCARNGILGHNCGFDCPQGGGMCCC